MLQHFIIAQDLKITQPSRVINERVRLMKQAGEEDALHTMDACLKW